MPRKTKAEREYEEARASYTESSRRVRAAKKAFMAEQEAKAKAKPKEKS